jgi:hypothetical protein
MAEENNNTPWYQGAEGVDPEMIGHWQNKGWDTSDPAKLAVAASKSQREAERLIGARVDHDLIAVPKDPTKGDWNGVWTKLGKPATAADYDFTGVTKKDGTAADEGFVTAVRDAAFKANLPKGVVPDIAKAVIAHYDGIDARTAAETSAKVTEEKTALAKNWGTTPDKLLLSPHMLAAQKAVAALGVDPETVNALEKGLGYGKVMEMFRNIATKIGEDKFITGDGNGKGNQGLLTQDQAVARKADLMRDAAWVTKYLANDQEAKREMNALDVIITGAREQR